MADKYHCPRVSVLMVWCRVWLPGTGQQTDLRSGRHAEAMCTFVDLHNSACKSGTMV